MTPIVTINGVPVMSPEELIPALNALQAEIDRLHEELQACYDATVEDDKLTDEMAAELAAERARVDRTSAILDENAPTRTAPRYPEGANGRWSWVPWDDLRAALNGADR
jgi:hypothetical protein